MTNNSVSINTHFKKLRSGNNVSKALILLVFHAFTKIISKKLLKKNLELMKNSSHICVTKFYKTVNNMLRKNLHTTTKSYFNPIVDDMVCGDFCSVS